MFRPMKKAYGSVADILSDVRDTIAKLDQHHVASTEASADHENAAAIQAQLAAHHRDQAEQAARVREKLAALIA